MISAQAIDDIHPKDEDIFTTFEMKCSNCSHWRIHQVLSSTTNFERMDHSTCICDLKKYGTVCCPEGLECILKNDESLVDEINVPKLSTMAMLLNKLHQKVDEDENDGPNFFFLKCQKIMQQTLQRK